ncbi:MAG: DUF4230 domain-containing protein [Armatimonadetes bacterium]|nr:DUF4230 domain-containing protein [Armatimonadota bacterium]
MRQRRERRRPWFGIAALLFLGAMFGIGISNVSRSSVTPTPLILSQVRNMGELRTVSHSYSQVFEHETAVDPEGWAANIPLAKQVVNAATRNRALVSVNGEVQAGVDLSQAEVLEKWDGIHIILPQATVYPASVTARMHDQKKGLLWRDINIGFKAELEAAKRMEEASRLKGISMEAEKQAAKVIEELVKPMTEKKVIVEYQ